MPASPVSTQQKMAQHAAKHCSSPRSDGKKNLATASKQAISRIRGSGLLAALLYGPKKEGVDETVSNALADYLENKQAKPLVHLWIEKDAAFLRKHTARALQYLDWLARFADAEEK